MKSKVLLSNLVLIIFAILGGGSFSGESVAITFVTIIASVAFIFIVKGIIDDTKNKNKHKRLQMIKDDEANSADFDRSVFIGDDRCKIYFDLSKKQVMIMRVMTEGIKKVYIDDFVFPGKEMSSYTSPSFNIYDPDRRVLLSGTYDDLDIKYQITSIAEKDKNKGVIVNNTIKPRFKIFNPSNTIYNILIDECRGLIAISEKGKVKSIINYISPDILPKKTGNTSAIDIKEVGNYFFIMDNFFKVLVLIGINKHEIFNYADIIDVSYEENGTQLFTKSTGRTVGGAIVGGVLMGGAGAVVGGLSGDVKQNKEISSMNVRVLLRNTTNSSYVLSFLGGTLTIKDDISRAIYESHLRDANEAKAIFSVIIDDVKQTNMSTNKLETGMFASVADELNKLAKLKESGILTEEEFNKQKSKLLN